jgi:hypothetical protein
MSIIDQIGSTMNFAGFNLRRLERDHSKILRRSLFTSRNLRACMKASAGCVKFADYRHTYKNLGIPEHRSSINKEKKGGEIGQP